MEAVVTVAKPRPERPPRPEISAEEYAKLEQLYSAVFTSGAAGDDISPTAGQDFGWALVQNSPAIMLDLRDLRRLREKLSRTIAKSNRRKSQLRQQGKTVELYAASLHNLRRHGVDHHVEIGSLSRQISALQEQLREERAQRRRAEDELYQRLQRQAPPPRGLISTTLP